MCSNLQISPNQSQHTAYVQLLSAPLSPSTSNSDAMYAFRCACDILSVSRGQHPFLMGFMILGMGVPGAAIGWAGRLDKNKKEGVQKKKLHENIMLAFFLLAFMGGFGGILATAMGGYDIFQSPHAKSAAAVMLLLLANTVIAYSGFTIGNDGSPKGRQSGRTLHAWFGTATVAALFAHAFLGIRILLE